MKEYQDFPPQKHFLRVLKNCPKSAFLYTQLWKKRSKYMTFEIHKKEVRKDFLISPTMFRNLLAPLMFMNLIAFLEGNDGFQIDISGPGSNE